MLRWLVAPLPVLLLLAGCSTGDDREPVVAPGTCIAKHANDNGDTVPDLTTAVPCSKPHTFEITAVFNLPASTLTGETDAQRLANRRDLASANAPAKPSPQRAAFDAFALEKCLPAMQKVSGLSAITVDGKSAVQARVNSALRYVNLDWHSVTPAKAWLDGKRQMICSSRFTSEQAGTAKVSPKPMASLNDKPIVPTLLTRQFKPEWRQCGSYDAEGTYANVDCSVQHFEELAFTFDGKAVFGRAFVEGFDIKSTDDAVYARLDQACADGLSDYLAPGWDQKVLKARGDIGREGWGTKGANFYPVLCKVVPQDSKTYDLPAGSLVDATGKNLKLVRIA